MNDRNELDMWQRGAREQWGDDLLLAPLPGECDRNFMVGGGTDAVLKVMGPECVRDDVEMQIALLALLGGVDGVPVPKLIPTRDGASIAKLDDANGDSRIAWMITRVPGTVLADVPVRSPELLSEIGVTIGRLHQAMSTFAHARLDRRFKWDLREAAWIRPHLSLIDDRRRRDGVTAILDCFQHEHRPSLERLPRQAIHNDINDHNLFVDVGPDGTLSVSGVIDFGDMIECPRLADLAIAGAYCIMGTADPVASLVALVSGYAQVQSLSAEEAEAIWPLVLTRLAVSVVNSAIMTQQRPDDPYVTVSEKPAWAILDRAAEIDAAFVRARMRDACGHPPVPHHPAVQAFLEKRRGDFARMFTADLTGAPVLDLSPAGADSPDDPFAFDAEALEHRIARRAGSDQPVLGRYREPRLIYTAPEFFRGAHAASDRRTIHLGVDVFLPAGTSLYAPVAGCVVAACWHAGVGDYGGAVVLEHQVPSSAERFFTLYGHLSQASVSALSIGDVVEEGQVFAALGHREENGGWPPHLHLQLGIEERTGSSWPGVADPDEADIWKQYFPNPASLLNLADDDVAYAAPDNGALAQRRSNLTVGNLRTSYATPLPIVRGSRHFLFDDRGRTYLDAYNNVPHVGHAHPVVVAAVHEQMRLLSTNTRYLNRTLVDYADALAARLPDGLDVCFFVNSGSEANDLAVRIARAHTAATDVFVSGAGYHGITTLNIALSHYKFAGPGGDGQQDWVHVVDIPDSFRGTHRGPRAAAGYAGDFAQQLSGQLAQGRTIAAFIAETFPSVGGQIVPPDGYLRQIYPAIRAAGGLAIADEVQTGLGRLGRFEWGFEHQDVVPDIVVLGKPLGNGYPIGAVVTTRAIADSFDAGMEFFSTFGGSTTSCAAGLAVLQVLDDEELALNAERTGEHLLQGLRSLAGEFPVIGDVRGLGLFLGVELMTANGSPATEIASQIVNGLRDRRILIGSDGPADNVLKIRPPLCFREEDADHLLEGLTTVLQDVSF